MSDGSPRLILASKSPRRAQLLTQCGFAFEVRTGDCDERWLSHETAPAYVRRVASEKAMACPVDHGGVHTVILAADTTVWLDEGPAAPLGKPVDWPDARALLQRLFEAPCHRVTTAVALRAVGAQVSPSLRVFDTTTEVSMRRPGEHELEAYRRSLEWSDKAGAYGIQGYAGAFVRSISGSYTSVVGLPLAESIEALAELGVHAPADATAQL